MVMADLVIVPVGQGESLSPFVAEILQVIAASGITWQLHPMGTVLEGDWPEVMAVVDACFQRAAGLAGRVSLTLRIDYRAGRESRLESKVAAVERILAEQRPATTGERARDAAD